MSNTTNMTYGPFPTENDVLYFAVSATALPLSLGLFLVYAIILLGTTMHFIQIRDWRRMLSTSSSILLAELSTGMMLFSTLLKMIDSFIEVSIPKTLLAGASVIFAHIAITFSMYSETTLGHTMILSRYGTPKIKSVALYIATLVPTILLYIIYPSSIITSICATFAYSFDALTFQVFIAIHAIIVSIDNILANIYFIFCSILVTYPLFRAMRSAVPTISPYNVLCVILQFIGVNIFFCLMGAMYIVAAIIFASSEGRVDIWAAVYILNRVAMIPMFLGIISAFFLMRKSIELIDEVSTDLIVYKSS